MNSRRLYVASICAALLLVALVPAAWSAVTAKAPIGTEPEYPPPGDYWPVKNFHSHLQAGTLTCTMLAAHKNFYNIRRVPGGFFRHEIESGDSWIRVQILCPELIDTVDVNTQFEVHSAARDITADVYEFDTVMNSLAGQGSSRLFSSFKIVGGNAFGMPSPGHTTVTRLDEENVSVDSQFNIGYRIEWVGADDGPFAGQSGVAEGKVVMAVQPPSAAGGGIVTE